MDLNGSGRAVAEGDRLSFRLRRVGEHARKSFPLELLLLVPFIPAMKVWIRPTTNKMAPAGKAPQRTQSGAKAGDADKKASAARPQEDSVQFHGLGLMGPWMHSRHDNCPKGNRFWLAWRLSPVHPAAMPELAEVEFFRRQWDSGLRQRITAVALHPDKRVFRGTDVTSLHKQLPGTTLLSSEAGGKQMLFSFSGGHWLGVHLGMTGQLSVQAPRFVPGRHDHLVLFQDQQALVFTDARQFGRIQFAHGNEPPSWWTDQPVPVLDRRFTAEFMSAFLDRHGRLPIKAALLLQSGFPGIGNWMADEILWKAGLRPDCRTGSLSPAARKRLWTEMRHVCRVALKRIGQAYEDAPRGWLFHQRWKAGGVCPRHQKPLQRDTVGGRTSAWCPLCQGSPDQRSRSEPGST